MAEIIKTIHLESVPKTLITKTGVARYLVGVYFICFIAIVIYFVFSVTHAIRKVNKIPARRKEEDFENPVQF